MATWLTTKDIANKTGLSYHTLKNYAHRGLNGMPKPDNYFSRTPVWSEETIDTWLQGRRTLKRKDKPQEQV
jgi:predicted DNA-binding transcriptional regulator AlpA